MRIAVTRPEAEGERSAAALRARGHDVLLTPLMRIEPVAADLGGDWSAVAITSANALAALGAQAQHWKHLPIFTVGRRSAAAAEGFAEVHSADGDVHALAALIAREHRGGRILYLGAEDRSADLIALLAAQGIEAALRIVYRAITLPYPPALIAALHAGALDAVLHYSRRSADNYVAGARTAGIVQKAFAPRQFCLSARVGEPLTAAGVRVESAPVPDEAALLTLLDMPGR